MRRQERRMMVRPTTSQRRPPRIFSVRMAKSHPRRKRTRSLRRRGNRLRLPRNRRIASSTKRSTKAILTTGERLYAETPKPQSDKTSSMRRGRRRSHGLQ